LLFLHKLNHTMIKTAHIVIFKDGKVLGVSRKDDHSDFGLPGGKMEDTDMENPEFTAIRECKEETGIEVFDLQLIFAIHKNGHMGYTYLANYISDEITHDEPHVVEWLPFETLVKGKFGKYNELVAESLKDMGVKFQY
jgi:8-oxo-dGTP pyrophosphatase MutT (NUDIX family)